jgi:hypothetical protein
MNEPLRARFPRSLRDSARAFDMYGFERLGTGGRQDTDGVDDGLGAFDGPHDRIGKPQIGLHGVDLPDNAHGLQIAGKIWPADGGPNPVISAR